ncbi:MAG: outer membrane beta-barrel protein [Verrucomicrobiota bacterium]
MNTPKGLTVISAIAASVLTNFQIQASPLVSIGDNTDIFFNGSSSVRWISNVFRDSSGEEEDILFTVSPGFEMNVGRGLSNADFSLVTRYDILRYVDLDRLDTEQFHITAKGSYKSSRLDLSGSVSFDQEQSTTGDENVVANDLIESDNFLFRVDGEYRFSPKFSFGAGFSYYDKEYTTFEDPLADRETTRIPLDVFYELTPKLDLSAGYSYEHSDIEGVTVTGIGTIRETSGYEREAHFFNVGFRGDILPKLKGSFKVGYRVRDTDDSQIIISDGDPMTPDTVGTTNRNDNGILGLDGKLTWLATPKLTTDFALSRDFGISGEGDATEATSLRVAASYSISSNWFASGNLGYTLRDYTDADREDNQYDIGLRVSYVLNGYWRFSTGYSYSENDSDLNTSSYENHSLDLTASLRY